VAIVDIRMPPTNVDEGLRAAETLRMELPEIGVLVLSQYVEESYAAELLADGAGAVGYLLKDVSSERLVEALLAAVRGESVLQPSVAAKVVARFATLPEESRPRAQPLVVPLSDRELGVVPCSPRGRATGRSPPRCSSPRAR